MRQSIITIAATLLAVSGCAKEDGNSTGNGPGDPPNTPSARDAAPGSLSETSPPSAPADERTQDEASADAKDDPPRQ